MLIEQIIELEWREPGPLQAKILKETEETISFLSLMSFQFRGGDPGPPLWLRLCSLNCLFS